MALTSLNDTIVAVAAGGAITDAQGNQWSIANGQVTVNGVADPTTARVIGLVYSSGQVWQQNADNFWWAKTTPGDQWSPPDGTSTAPTPDASTNPDVVTLSALGGPITDAHGNTWTIVNGQVSVNGAIDATTRNVIELAYVNGKVWQENEDRLWWSKGSPSDSWNPPYGTTQNPAAGVTRIWGGETAAFSTAGDWTPGGVPQADDTALVKSGEVSVDSGFATGVNFTLQGNAVVQFNGRGTYDVGRLQGTGTIDAGFQTQRVSVVSSGVHLAVGDALVLDEYSLLGSFILRGNSTLGSGSSLTVRYTAVNHEPYGVLENDGTLAINHGSVAVGDLTGTGVVSLANGSNMVIDLGGAPTSETIQLKAGHLEIGMSGPSSLAMRFMAPITQFGSTSSVTLDSTKSTSFDFVKSSPTAGELFLYNGSTVVADLHISGQSTLFVSYDPTVGPFGATTIAASHSAGSGALIPGHTGA